MDTSPVHQVWPKPSCKAQRGKKTRQTGKEVGRQLREGTSLEFAKSQRAVENTEKWRKLVVKSPVVPKRPQQLRDR